MTTTLTQNCAHTLKSLLVLTRYCRWAAKSILIGFGFLAAQKSWELVNHPFPFRGLTAMPMHLTTEEVFWVAHLGRFKGHFNLLKDSDPSPRVSQFLFASPVCLLITGCFLHLEMQVKKG